MGLVKSFRAGLNGGNYTTPKPITSTTTTEAPTASDNPTDAPTTTTTTPVPTTTTTEEPTDNPTTNPPVTTTTTQQTTTTQHVTTTTQHDTTTTKNGVPECKAEGFLRNLYDCQLYYVCRNDGEGGFIRTEHKCDGELVFNLIVNVCDFLVNVPEC